tara:strand:+ start:93 stop:548 length:456 start_codon:yes stop_codon:yes gene_type:complete
LTVRTNDVTGFSRERIIKQIRENGKIPQKTNDERCPIKCDRRCEHKCDGGEMTTVRSIWTANNAVYQKHLAKLDAEILAKQTKINQEKLAELIIPLPKDEPLQILNEIQHIKPEIIETPIQEKSFLDKNKNYLIIGGIGIFAVILILVVRK